MVALPPEPSPTVDAIYDRWQARGRAEGHRTHLGASQIGKECARAIWYGFRWASSPGVRVSGDDHEGRLYRLFDRGRREESVVVGDLRAIGVEVHEHGPDGKQFTFAAIGGHYGGSMDGVVLGLPEAPKTWHVLEVKTASKWAHNDLIKRGVRQSKPEHWAQCQAYMRAFKLTRAVYISVCKDNDRIYLERIRIDKKTGEALEKRALQIIQDEQPPPRASDNPDKQPCRYCDHVAVCHKGAVPEVNCRTCIHAEPLVDGEGARWLCHKDDREIPKSKQQVGCDEYLPIPELVPWGRGGAVDAGDDWYAVETDTGRAAVGTPTAFPPHPTAHGRDVGTNPPSATPKPPSKPGRDWSKHPAGPILGPAYVKGGDDGG